MEFWKRPLWRVPVVLGGLGLLCRLLSFILSFAWGRIQIAQGPGPDGSVVLTTGYVGEIVAAVMFLLFWLAGWRFVRGLTRRQIFASATIMVLVYAALLAAEQIGQAVTGSYPMWVYRLWVLAEGKSWVDQLLFRLTGTVSLPMAIPGLFAPYLYLVFGKKDVPQ